LAAAIACDPAFLAEVSDEQQEWLALHLADLIRALLADQPLPIEVGKEDQGSSRDHVPADCAALDRVAAAKWFKRWFFEHTHKRIFDKTALTAVNGVLHAAFPPADGASSASTTDGDRAPGTNKNNPAKGGE